MNRFAPIAALIILATVACSSGEAMTPIDRWFSTARTLTEQQQPDSDLMQIDPNVDCELVSEIEIGDKPLELFGAATALFGEVGSRYQCVWSGDTNTSANVRLEVITIDDPADFDDYKNLIPTRDGNTVIATDIGDVQVASFRPDPATPPLTTSVLVDDDQQGGIHLVVEILDPTINFTPQDHAQLLATIVNGT